MLAAARKRHDTAAFAVYYYRLLQHGSLLDLASSLDGHEATAEFRDLLPLAVPLSLAQESTLDLFISFWISGWNMFVFPARQSFSPMLIKLCISHCQLIPIVSILGVIGST